MSGISIAAAASVPVSILWPLCRDFIHLFLSTFVITSSCPFHEELMRRMQKWWSIAFPFHSIEAESKQQIGAEVAEWAEKERQSGTKAWHTKLCRWESGHRMDRWWREAGGYTRMCERFVKTDKERRVWVLCFLAVPSTQERREVLPLKIHLRSA